jgi:hypothetical protein
MALPFATITKLMRRVSESRCDSDHRLQLFYIACDSAPAEAAKVKSCGADHIAGRRLMYFSGCSLPGNGASHERDESLHQCRW